jgi:serine protease AprX
MVNELSHPRRLFDPLLKPGYDRLQRLGLIVLIVMLAILLWPLLAGAAPHHARVSPDIAQRLQNGDNTDTAVIVTGTRERIEAVVERHGLRVRKWLKTGAAIDVPPGFLERVVADEDVDQLSGNLPVMAHMAVTNVAIGADQLHQDGWAPGMKALTGKGVGVAVIDSGVAFLPALKGRITKSLDFTDGHGPGIDQNGHGTHIAGIIAGGAHNKHDEAIGVAPEANIISLRVLDEKGRGLASDVIDAIDWAVANRQQFNIQVINLSLGAPVLQSWRDDPLDQAVERAYRAGITVIAAAGNFGKDQDGHPLRGGITAPGNSPFAITVGAVNTHGTPWRSDDEVAGYSSRGQTAIDHLVKPDLVAPGNRIRSLLAPNSWIAREHPELVVGSGKDAELELSGTSMSAAVVSGAAAVLEAAGNLSPIATRVRLQWASSRVPGTGLLSGGSGELNVLAAALGNSGDHPISIASESISVSALGFAFADLMIDAQNILWGTSTNILWGTADNILWGTSDNILWGTADNILWGTSNNILWGTADNILWGTADNILWGTSDNILWGTAHNILWGTTLIYGE